MKPTDLADSLGVNLSPSEEPLDSEESDEVGLAGRGKPSAKFTLGRVAFDRKGFTQYRAESIDNKREYLKNQWLDLTYLLLGKATTLAQTVQKKDFGRLVQILTSAGIAHDKVFPKVNDPSVSNLVVNMFKGLPNDRVLRVIGGVPTPSTDYLQEKPLVSNLAGEKPLGISLPLPPTT